jgi:hypothetical protein
MTHDHMNDKPDLHLHDDPEIAQTESLLDLLAKQDASSMPADLELSVLDSISSIIAPAPIEIPQPCVPATSGKFWSLRLAAAAALATGTTLVIVGTQPWASNTGGSLPEVTLASFEQDLNAFFELESVDDGNLSEAVSEWEIWAQSVDMEIDSSLIGLEWDEPIWDDGAL